MSIRVSEAEVRRAQVERENFKQARDTEQSRFDAARGRRGNASQRATFFRYVLTCRQFCDRTITRPGGLVNVLVTGGALALIGSSLIGLPNHWRIWATVAGSSIAALFGALLLTPSDAEVAARIGHWEQECVELDSVMVEAREKTAGHEARLDEADTLCKRLLAVYLSRINQLLHCRWPEMTGVDFENFLASVFQELGYEVRATPTTGDQGVDLIVSKNGRKVAVQAKGDPRSTAGNTAVQEARTGMVFYDCHAAAVITNSDFTPAARELAAKVGCVLVARHQMRELIEGRILL